MSALSALGIPSIRNHIPLSLALVIDSIAAGIAAPVFLLYFIEVARIPIGVSGTIIACASFIALAAPAVVVGSISRLGARTTLTLAQIVQGVAFAGIIVAGTTTWLVALFATLAAIGQRAFWSSVFPYIAEVAAASTHHRDDTARWFAFAGMVQAAGMAAGAALVGALLLNEGTVPYIAALLASCASFLISALLLRFQRSRLEPPTEHQLVRPMSQPLLRNRPYLALTLVNTVFATCTVSLALSLPIYVVQALDLPRALIGPMLMIVTIANATCQGLIVRAFLRFRATRVIAAAGALWALWGISMVALLSVDHRVQALLLIGATLIFCAAQLLHAPISNSLASAAAPKELRGEYLAFFQYSFAIASVIAPAMFGWLFIASSALPYAMLSIMAALAAVALLLVGPHLTLSHQAAAPVRSAQEIDRKVRRVKQ